MGRGAKAGDLRDLLLPSCRWGSPEGWTREFSHSFPTISEKNKQPYTRYICMHISLFFPFLQSQVWFCIFILQRKEEQSFFSKLTFNWECGWCHGGVCWQNDEWRSRREKLNAISYHKPQSWNFKTILTAVVPQNRTLESILSDASGLVYMK